VIDPKVTPRELQVIARALQIPLVPEALEALRQKLFEAWDKGYGSADANIPCENYYRK
jgi:hypothetical protein